jgi:hypothetical protein
MPKRTICPLCQQRTTTKQQYKWSNTAKTLKRASRYTTTCSSHYVYEYPMEIMTIDSFSFYVNHKLKVTNVYKIVNCPGWFKEMDYTVSIDECINLSAKWEKLLTLD